MAEQSSTLCWSCKYACGKCPWSECDKETRELKWQPVEGWKAKKTKIMMHSQNTTRKRKHYETSYIVKACPEYKEG
jgi:hypothetical protein